MRSTLASSVACTMLLAGPVLGGVYRGSLTVGGTQGPGTVTHPNTYTGSAGPITIGVCLNDTATELAADTAFAIAKWNELRAKTQNCSGPCAPNEGPFPPAPYSEVVFNTIMHELGHCALGLEHINWVNAGIPKDYTMTRSAVSFASSNSVHGDYEDLPSPLPGSRVVHWYRAADNDPIVVDSTVIDSSTYTRSLSFPGGDTWVTSANSSVSASLGQPGTQSLMVGVSTVNSSYLFFSADDVNTVRFAMNGIDADPGDTSDDYTYTMVLQPDCSTAQVEIQYVPHADFGFCDAEVEQLSHPSIITHYRVVPSAGHPRALITIDSSPMIGATSVRLLRLLAISQFEAGDFSEWSSVVP